MRKPPPLFGAGGEGRKTNISDREYTPDATAPQAHAARHLHRLGPRPVLEAMLEVEAGRSVADVLARYSRLDPCIVRALGGDDFAPLPLHVVEAA